MHEPESQQSFGDHPTLGRKPEPKRPAPAPDAPSWTAQGLSEATTLSPPVPPTDIADDGRTNPPRRWKSGDVLLGRYVVEGELGQGGMGVVYSCLDRTGGVRVAIKSLPPELAHNSVEMEEVRENFRLVVGLRHPCIAGVRTLEKDEEGGYFLVMDIAEGESLRKWMRDKWKSGGISLAEAVPILRQVASALDYAHGRKIIHRDIKPGNVMIDNKGEVKVLDFGLADQIRTSLSRASQAYRGTSGTGPYMSPEQWRGRQQNGKTDQYALAVLAYEMLAGHLPFENSDPTVLKASILEDAPEPIPNLPQRSMSALTRGLAKRAENRFPSCTEFVDALSGTSRTTRSTQFGGWIVALLLAAVVGSGVWWWQKNARLKEEVYQLKPLAKTKVENAIAKEYDRGQGFGEKLDEAKNKFEQGVAALEGQDFVRAKKLFKTSIGAVEWCESNDLLRQEAVQARHAATEANATMASAEYDRGQGFGKRIDEAKSKFEAAEEALREGEFSCAKKFFEESKASAAWCETNAPLRQAAVQARDGAGMAKAAAEMMDGAQLGLTAWRKAEQCCLSAGKAFEKSDFNQAGKEWKEAQSSYVRSETDARVAKVGQGLEAAREAKRREAWEEVMKAAEGVLELDVGNVEAKALKAEAEGMLKPSIVLTATLDGREVAATVVEGLPESGQTTPATLKLEHEGEYPFAVTYEADGKKYVGRRIVKAAAHGVTKATVVLEEVKEREAGETKTIALPGGATMEMVWCPPGSFMMGSPLWEDGRDNDEAQHRVTLTEGFWMAKYEVTQAQWMSVMGNNPSYSKGDSLPVVRVSWNDAREFCQKAGNGLRLPTEAEWERGCRAGSATAYFWGNTLNGERGNCNGNYPCGTTVKGPYLERTAPVWSYWPNAWGVYNVHGNVHEWCADWYGKYTNGGVTNPTGPVSGTIRVLRGGSWGSVARGCRSANRGNLDPGSRLDDVGFRPVCSDSWPDTVTQRLAAARAAQAIGAWEEVIKISEEVLALDAGNAEAKTLKAEAEGKFKGPMAENAREAGSTKTIILPGGAPMEMVWCPPGSFTMGSPPGEEGRYGNETQHRVTLTEGFWMARYEVSQWQWQSVMGGNPSIFKGENLPVENVSWDNCREFCRKCRDEGVALRLPTEAEWEYACRAGSTGTYAGTGDLDTMGWYSGNSGSSTQPVGQKHPNAWGLYDMHGNVWEWCEDPYGTYPSGAVTNPTRSAVVSDRVSRGGSWYNNARVCRSANRGNGGNLTGGPYCRGFRPVCADSFSDKEVTPEMVAWATKVMRGLKAACEAKRRRAWNEVVKHAEEVLTLDEGNAAAKNLKAEAEGMLAASIAVKEKVPGETKTITLPGGVAMEMVWCPPGSFMMGSPASENGRGDDEVQHRVTLTEGFWMAKTEVTEKQWQSVMGGRWGQDNIPISGVVWNDCQEFCRKCRDKGVALRLPTEAEWEYACRAGSTGAYAGDLACMGWYACFGKQAVGQKQPNAWGLHDMHGNMKEWCADWYGPYPSGSVTNPTGPVTGVKRVLRGGSWHLNAKSCRSAYRYSYAPENRDGYYGFRPVCSAGLL